MSAGNTLIKRNTTIGNLAWSPAARCSRNAFVIMVRPRRHEIGRTRAPLVLWAETLRTGDEEHDRCTGLDARDLAAGRGHPRRMCPRGWTALPRRGADQRHGAPECEAHRGGGQQPVA